MIARRCSWSMGLGLHELGGGATLHAGQPVQCDLNLPCCGYFRANRNTGSSVQADHRIQDPELGAV